MSTRGERRHLVTLQGPSGSGAPDGEGNWTPAYGPLTPAQWMVSINPAAARELERLGAGTTITQASHIVEGAYRADITTQTQILFKGRTFHVNSVLNMQERDIRTVCVCQELVA